jgi:hypothetical protein
MNEEMLYIEGSFCKFAEAKENELPKFRIVANTGALMQMWRDKIAIDVDGVFAHTEPVPIFSEHNSSDGIGHSTNIHVDDGSLVIEGVVSRETESARDFVSSAKNGFPWQASVGGYVRDEIKLKDGETLDLHGETIKGPAIVATKFELYEVSVCVHGADKNTSSTITAHLGADTNLKGANMGLENKEPITNEPVTATEVDDGLEKQLQAAREAHAAELERVAEIRARSMGDDEALQAQAIREGWSADKFELHALRSARGTAPAVHTPQPDAEVSKKALTIATIRAMGYQASEDRFSDQQLTAADDLGRIGFFEIAERAAGASPFSFHKDPFTSIRASISTSNLGSVLSSSGSAVLEHLTGRLNTQWKQVFKVGDLDDYKETDRFSLEDNFELKKVPTGGEMEHGEFADEKYTIQAEDYGRQYAIPKKYIVNGEALKVYASLLESIALAANTAINRQAWGLFMNPSACADGKAFYHADHGSLKTCTFTFDNLASAREAFIQRKKAKSTKTDESLGIEPSLIVVPTALEFSALMATKATTLNNGSAANNPADYNPYAGRFTVVGVPYLSFPTFTNYSSTTWYLAADPTFVTAFEIAFLNGQEFPTIRQEDMEIGKLGIAFDASFAFGVAQRDYRGVLKCTASQSN